MKPMSYAAALALTLASFATPALAADAPSCPTTPDRLVVLGDSIMACYGVGNADSPDCGPYQYHEALRSDLPDLTYENLAINGATTGSLVRQQLLTVPTGPGHTQALIYVGGNDLYAYLYLPGEFVLSTVWPQLEGKLRNSWAQIFTYFENPENFPDGATIIINTQYNPFDDCYGTSAEKIELLSLYNEMIDDLTTGYPNRIVADPYTPFLGHGHNHQRRLCPYYEKDAEYWFADTVHPNPAGHEQLGYVWGDLWSDQNAVCE